MKVILVVALVISLVSGTELLLSKSSTGKKFSSKSDRAMLPKDLSDTLSSLSGKCQAEQENCGEFCQNLTDIIKKLAEKAKKNDPRACVACAFHHVLTQLAQIHEKELDELNKKDEKAADAPAKTQVIKFLDTLEDLLFQQNRMNFVYINFNPNL